MEQKKAKIDYEKLVSYISELQQIILDTDTLRKLNFLATELENMKNQNEIMDINAIESSRVKDILIYIYEHYDRSKDSIRKISKRLENPERKYQDVAVHMKILAYRKAEIPSEENKEESKKILRLALYLNEVRKQRHLAMAGEVDRSERVRFREILECIDRIYDGTDESTRRICELLESRGDMDEVLKYYESEKPKEEER